mmetsp:Transcript_1594/g.5148  ORF Transcript_1594/g.5148 Transcript_1594/m.5148 type:complete len:408 (+) Transcript_1594:870-2093(+)
MSPRRSSVHWSLSWRWFRRPAEGLRWRRSTPRTSSRRWFHCWKGSWRRSRRSWAGAPVRRRTGPPLSPSSWTPRRPPVTKRARRRLRRRRRRRSGGARRRRRRRRRRGSWSGGPVWRRAGRRRWRPSYFRNARPVGWPRRRCGTEPRQSSQHAGRTRLGSPRPWQPSCARRGWARPRRRRRRRRRSRLSVRLGAAGVKRRRLARRHWQPPLRVRRRQCWRQRRRTLPPKRRGSRRPRLSWPRAGARRSAGRWRRRGPGLRGRVGWPPMLFRPRQAQLPPTRCSVWSSLRLSWRLYAPTRSGGWPRPRTRPRRRGARGRWRWQPWRRRWRRDNPKSTRWPVSLNASAPRWRRRVRKRPRSSSRPGRACGRRRPPPPRGTAVHDGERNWLRRARPDGSWRSRWRACSNS